MSPMISIKMKRSVILDGFSAAKKRIALQRRDIWYVLWWSLALLILLGVAWLALPTPLREPTIRYKGSRSTPEGTELLFEVKNDSGGTWCFAGDSPTRPQYNLRVDSQRWISESQVWKLWRGRNQPGGGSRVYDLLHGHTIEVAVPAPSQPARYIEMRIAFTPEPAATLSRHPSNLPSSPTLLFLLRKASIAAPETNYVNSDVGTLP